MKNSFIARFSPSWGNFLLSLPLSLPLSAEQPPAAPSSCRLFFLSPIPARSMEKRLKRAGEAGPAAGKKWKTAKTAAKCFANFNISSFLCGAHEFRHFVGYFTGTWLARLYQSILSRNFGEQFYILLKWAFRPWNNLLWWFLRIRKAVSQRLRNGFLV